MTLNLHADDRLDPERPTDPRPAWERIAYTWLAREVDAGQPVDSATLARDVSVAPGFARDLVRVLRGQRDRDPALSELRGRLVRDRITDAYLRRELAGGSRLDPAELATEVGTSPAAARQWLAGLRAQHNNDRAWRCSASRPATATLRPASSPACRRISPPVATSRPLSPVAPPVRSGWPPRSNATTGPARSAAVSGCSPGSSPGSWTATSAASASSSPSCAPARRPPASGSLSSGTPMRRTLLVGR
jgi:hypothetical protein